MTKSGRPDPGHTPLRRTLSLPLLVFYGIGVTVGAGIFALIGEITKIAGDQAPLAFIMAGAIAAVTGLSYAKLSVVFPRAAGEAVYVKTGLGPVFAQFVGFAVVATGIISSAVITLAFAGYLNEIVNISENWIVFLTVAILCLIACNGVRESVMLATLITIIEVGGLSLIIGAGMSNVVTVDTVIAMSSINSSAFDAGLIASASFVAFFAFIGFEDIVNMAEETVDPQRVLPKAIYLTFIVSTLIYFLIALVAIAVPGRSELVESNAPLATMFEMVTGMSGAPIVILAAAALVNGIVVQMIMASRVLYGMARENIAPRFLGYVDPRRKTPVIATLFVSLVIISLAYFVPLLQLAKMTSYIVLIVFSLVNISLWAIGNKDHADPAIRRWRYWGLFGAFVTGFLIVFELYQNIFA